MSDDQPTEPVPQPPNPFEQGAAPQWGGPPPGGGYQGGTPGPGGGYQAGPIPPGGGYQGGGMPPGPGYPPTAPSRKWYERKRVLLPIVAVLFFVLGAAIGGGASQVAQQDATPGDDEAALAVVEGLEEERDAFRSQAEELQLEVDDLRRELADATGEDAPEPAPEAEAEPEDAPAADGTYTAGTYEFADVQVRSDFVDDFELRARVTNTGQDRNAVSWTATIFSGGSVAATLSGIASDFSSGSTITVEFFSTDDYRDDWDEIEFQIDAEF